MAIKVAGVTPWIQHVRVEKAHQCRPEDARHPGHKGRFPGFSPDLPGAHPAFSQSPSILQEIRAATATQDTPWSFPQVPSGNKGVEAILEVPLSEDYQALRDMLSGSPGPGA